MAAVSAPGLLRSSLARERGSWQRHRERVCGAAFAPPGTSPPTFLDGFLLPFSLIAATLRHPTLGLTHLRVLVVRAVLLAGLSTLLFHLPRSEGRTEDPKPVAVTVDEGKKEIVLFGNSFSATKHPDAVGVPLDPRKGRIGKITLTGPTKHGAGALKSVADGWSWLLWFAGVLSALEGILFFLSRRWDDWIGFHLSAIARVRPEEARPKPPRISFDPRFLFKKGKRRLRGYIVFATGLPLLYVFRAIPVAGPTLFAIAASAWGWYWLAVFTAAKSAHAWADDEAAPAPLLVRELRDRSTELPVLKPVHFYARLWARIVRSINAPSATFERSPAPFLGLALARLVLSLPGLYLLARPVLPVAASRLIAEGDPDRFGA